MGGEDLSGLDSGVGFEELDSLEDGLAGEEGPYQEAFLL